ncbi:STM3941 family protein [Flavobacterium sp. SUN052]|uniref:STM3941 family protein n=1 Tax=Flavobacterium sp. SUN052 TaxID=3002441 RepID=UPI00237EAB5B|nr:STM3941 family protein [Flavobacterium sp. SUN052]MEC4005858.1 STM3941 family protein [Flavobacterium sp. SUN052]
MTEIKLYKSSRNGFKLIALSLPFVIIGIWAISKETFGTFDYIMGWISLLFFGLGILIGVFTLLDKRVQIIINEKGIFDKTLKQGLIKWEQIIEVYPIDINNQKFISIVVDETFEFKKNQYKWTEKLNYLVGAQKLNLNLSQIKIDENKLSELINKIANSEKNERLNFIRKFSSDKKLETNYDYTNFIIYFLILIILVFISLQNFIGFMSVIILMGISALIVKWYSGTNNKSNLYKYARIMTYLGFLNIVVLFLFFKIYDSTSNKVGLKISNEIETYKSNFGKYPNEINSIREKLNLNVFQDYIANKIEYKNSGNEYKLELETFNNNQKEFDNELKEWN